VLDELLPAACHLTERNGNNLMEADHETLKLGCRQCEGLKRLATAAVVAAGHALVQNPRRGRYEHQHRRRTRTPTYGPRSPSSPLAM
jgi:transposase, IS6 family